MPFSDSLFRDCGIVLETALTLDDPRRYPYRRGACRNIVQNDCVGTDLGVFSDIQLTQYFGACPHVNMAFQGRYPTGGLADRDLLKNQAIRPNLGTRVNDYAVWMRQE